MNALENLETLLRGCRPRRPSPRLRRRLFERPVRDDRPARTTGLWMAPLTAGALLLMSLATVWSPGGGRAATGLALAALPLAWEPAVTQVERNALPKPSFHSTTTGAITPAFGSLLIRQTNVFAR